jgi:hypothetical protein
MAQWYYAKSGQQIGPVSKDELVRLSGTGELSADDLVWTAKLPEWVVARRVPGLVFPPPAPPQIATAEGARRTGAAAARLVDAYHSALYATLAERPLAKLRTKVSPELIDKIENWAAIAGQYSLTACAIFGAVDFVASAVRSDEGLGPAIALAAVWAIVLLLLAYVNRRLLGILSLMARNTRSCMVSTAWTDGVALLAVGGLAATAYIALFTGASAPVQYAMLVAGAAGCLFVVLLCVNPANLAVDIQPRHCTFGNEGVGAVLFLVKLGSRATAVWWGGGLLVAAIGVTISAVRSLLGSDSTSILTALDAWWYAPLASYLLLPVEAYFLVIVLGTLAELVQSILRLPHEVDRVAPLAVPLDVHAPEAATAPQAIEPPQEVEAPAAS